jgi:hypothetical protein
MTCFTLSLLLIAPAARAQGSSNVTTTTSTSRTQTLHTTNNAVEVDNFLTRLTARIGNGALLYDQTFNVQLSDPTVQTAIQQARAQLTNAGAVSISGPNQQANVKTLTGTNQSTVVNSTQTTQDTVIETSIGPGTILIGNLGLCSGLPGTGLRPTGCPGGTPFNVLAGTSNLNFNTNTQSDIFQTVTTTSTYQIAQTYELVGTAQAPPATPLPPSIWFALTGLAAAGLYLMRRRFAR